MSAVTPLHARAGKPARIALLGTGTVGSAAWARLVRWEGTPLGERLSLVHVANSRFAISNRDGVPADTRELLLRNAPRPSSLELVETSLAGDGIRIVIDATASDEVAEWHARWLANGIHVATACKLGQGTSLARWHAIQAAQAGAGTGYGDSATVGAGLPLLRTLRALQAGGDRIHAIAGVLSGRVQPSGKLPVQVPSHVGGQPSTYLQPPLGGTEGEGITTVWGHPLFPFGFGASYTSFEIDGLQLSRDEIATDGEVMEGTSAIDASHSRLRPVERSTSSAEPILTVMRL